MVICLERDAELHMAQLMPLPLTFSCFSKMQIGFTFLVVAHPGSPGKKSLNGHVCICVHEEMTFKTVNYVTLHPSVCVWSLNCMCWFCGRSVCLLLHGSVVVGTGWHLMLCASQFSSQKFCATHPNDINIRSQPGLSVSAALQFHRSRRSATLASILTATSRCRHNHLFVLHGTTSDSWCTALSDMSNFAAPSCDIFNLWFIISECHTHYRASSV